MGIMAGQAATLAYHRPMHAVFIKSLIEHFIVATTAETDAFFFGLQRCSAARFLMALVAHPFTDWRMNILHQQTAVVRAMGVMTTCTAGICYRIAHMFLDEDRFVGFMAAEAELGHLVLKQGFSLVRRMGQVTGEAILFNR